MCEAIAVEFESWRQRDLLGLELDYLYLDAAHFRMHEGARAEPVLAAWGIDTAGAPVSVGLAAAAGESADAWADFLADLRARGLGSPIVVISDGAPGLIGAIETSFPRALRQRCAIHRARNILAKVSAADQAEVKAAYWAILEGIEAPRARRRSPWPAPGRPSSRCATPASTRGRCAAWRRTSPP